MAIVISNQAGVGKKRMSQAALTEINRKMRAAIQKKGGELTAIYTCTDLPDSGSPDRKPAIGMLRKAAKRFSIDLKKSFVVGDSLIDVQMGQKAGCKTILVLSGKAKRSDVKKLRHPPDKTAQNLKSAATWILAQ